MMELEEINVREKMINLGNSDNIFKSILEPRMNIMDFSNKLSILNQTDGDRDRDGDGDDHSPTSLHVPRAADDALDKSTEIKCRNLRK